MGISLWDGRFHVCITVSRKEYRDDVPFPAFDCSSALDPPSLASPNAFFDKSNTANNAELVSGIKLMVVPRPGNVQETRPIRYFVLNLKMTPVNLRGPPSTPVGSPLQVGLRYYPPRRARLACCIQQRGTRHGFKTTLTCWSRVQCNTKKFDVQAFSDHKTPAR